MKGEYLSSVDFFYHKLIIRDCVEPVGVSDKYRIPKDTQRIIKSLLTRARELWEMISFWISFRVFQSKSRDCITLYHGIYMYIYFYYDSGSEAHWVQLFE